MAEEREELHLRRIYPHRSETPWACTIVLRPDLPAGFEIVASDPRVADTGWLSRLDRYFRATYRVMVSGNVRSAIVDKSVEAGPGEDGHYGGVRQAMITDHFALMGPTR